MEIVQVSDLVVWWEGFFCRGNGRSVKIGIIGSRWMCLWFGVFVGYGCSSPFISFHKGGTAHTFHLYHLERIDGATLMHWFNMAPYPKPPFGRCKHFTHRDVEEVQGFSLDVHMVKRPMKVILFILFSRFLSATPKDFTTSLHGSESESQFFSGRELRKNLGHKSFNQLSG